MSDQLTIETSIASSATGSTPCDGAPSATPETGTSAPSYPPLSDAHRAQLRDGSGISDEVIAERGYRTVMAADVRRMGFPSSQVRDGLLIPLLPPDGSNGLYILRPDKPRALSGKTIKYEMRRDSGLRLDCPPRCRPMLADPAIEIWFTEGQKKADALASRGFCVIALLGVYGFLGRNAYGATAFLTDFDAIGWKKGRVCNIVFDSDVSTKPEVGKALDRFREFLQRKGATVNIVYLPPMPDGNKCGVDDFLLIHSNDELDALRQGPKPEIKAAAPTVELLEDEPLSIVRPLQIVNGRAYAVVWPYVRTTTTEIQDRKSGEVVKLSEPSVNTERREFVIRGDGVIFGDGGDKSIEGLGLGVKLPEFVKEAKQWRIKSVNAYRRGERPAPADVFARVASVYDRFIDFDRSLASQSDMCKLSACASLVTWFSEATTVLPYFWPNGEKGSGKTQWGMCWVLTSYLGEMITAGGTFAAIRDLADYAGACCYDDAENISDKKYDPDKKALLLAGNRRGVQIPLKELAGDRWQTRWVNAFAPKAFTAIAVPDHVLASRAIVLPLVRTADPGRGNADPANLKCWPCDQRVLQDDLWALALQLLPEAARLWDEFDNETDAVGRDFEPWRGLLTVGRLMERHGVTRLERCVRNIMTAYHQNKPRNLGDDWSIATVRALVTLADNNLPVDSRTVADGVDSNMWGWLFTAKEVSERIALFHLTESDGGECWASPERVGRILGALRFQTERAKDSSRTRNRWIGAAALVRAATAYKVEIPHKLRELMQDRGLHITVHPVQNCPTVQPKNTDSETFASEDGALADMHGEDDREVIDL